MITKQDREIIRELARTYAEIAADPVNEERRLRAMNNNDLIAGRPIVWIDEIPWNELEACDDFLVCKCESADAKKYERFFRRKIYQWNHFQADMVVENAYYIEKAYDDTGIGVDVWDDTRAFDASNQIVSHEYHDQLETEEQLEKLHPPVITARPDLDAIRVAEAEEILDGILPVKLRGTYIAFGPWDEISMLRGVEPIYVDLYDRPEFMHATRQKFQEIGMSRAHQLEEQGLLDWNLETVHCTPPYSRSIPQQESATGSYRLKDVWFRGACQVFASVSPAMTKEYDIDYMKPFMEMCGMVYYGCCEPLDNKISLLRDLPNMRKIGCSPWAKVRSTAEQIGKDFVLARKPNPANVAGELDEDVVRKETIETIEACLAYHCPYEMVLKDISTISYRPENLIKWNKIVQETLDHYY